MSVELSKYSGSGNATLKASSLNNIHTGRKDKTTTYKGVTSKGAIATVKVVEKAHNVIFHTNTSYIYVSNKGGILNIQITTNQKGVIIDFDGYAPSISSYVDSPDKWIVDANDNFTTEVLIADGIEYYNETAHAEFNVSKNQGADNSYTIDIKIEWKWVNQLIGKQYYYLYLKPILANGNNYSDYEIEIEIEQEAGSAYVYVNTNGTSETTSAEAIMTQQGIPLNFYIMSNTQWQITNE